MALLNKGSSQKDILDGEIGITTANVEPFDVRPYMLELEPVPPC